MKRSLLALICILVVAAGCSTEQVETADTAVRDDSLDRAANRPDDLVGAALAEQGVAGLTGPRPKS